MLTTVLASELTNSLVGLGVPRAEATDIAHDAARNGAPSADSTSHVPGAIADQLHAVIARDYATATQGVFYGMAIALGVCFLAALAYPRTRK